MEIKSQEESISNSDQSYNSSSIALVLTACIISILLIYMIYTRNIVFGSEMGHWVYPYFQGVPVLPLGITGIIILLVGLQIFLGSRFIHTFEEITLTVCFINAVVIQSLMLKIYPYTLGELIQSDSSNSFLTPATQYSAYDILSKYIELAPSFPLHAGSNLPGKILLFELFKIITSSTEVMGYLVIILSSLGALLLYGICKQLFKDRQIAFYALTLYVLIPSKLVFFPVLNTVTPVFILLFFLLFLVYLDKKQVWIPWMLGVVLYILIMFEPTPMTIGILLIAFLVQAIRNKRITAKDLWRLITHSVLAFSIIYGFFFVFYSFDLLRSFMFVLKDAVGFNTVREREYMIWFYENIKEFFIGSGIPIAIIVIYMAAQMFSQWMNPEKHPHWSTENVYLIGLIATLGVVVVLGINRGEVTRLWIYLAVLVQIPAAFFLARIKKHDLLFLLVVGTLIFQNIITLHRVGFVIP